MALLSGAAVSVSAALPTNAILKLDSQTGFCDFGLGTYPDNCTVAAIPDGNYFAMDNDGSGSWENGERVGFGGGSDGGITLAGAQPNYGTDGATGTPLDPGQIDAGWDFFGSHGWHITTAAPSIISDDGAGNVTLGMSGFFVHWNGGDIDMGQGADAVLTCANTCAENDTFTLDYNAVVPSGSFTGVAYQFHLTGTITLPLATNDAPVANDDVVTVDRKATGRPYILPVLDILANDTDANSISDINIATVAIQTDVLNGTTSYDPLTGNVTYTPNDDFIGTDFFTYSVTDKGGPAGAGAELSSNIATVNITVQNAVPVAIDDVANIDVASNASVLIDIASNDTDSDGTIDASFASVSITSNVSGGVIVVEANGSVTYTPNSGFIGTDSFLYTIKDNDGTDSNPATVVINVSDSSVDGLSSTAFLVISGGTGRPGQGSLFSMEVNPGQLTYTGIAGFDNIQLGTTQLASVAMPGIDNPWLFFGSLGVHQTTSDVTILTDDGAGNVTLDFSGWDVSWNNIASIPLGAGADNGIATLTCDIKCAAGESFTLVYRATVPEGDPSSFGGVSYILDVVGVIADGAPSLGGGDDTVPHDVTGMFAVDDSTNAAAVPITVGAGSIATAAGNTSGVHLTATEIGSKDPLLNDADGVQCLGGCIDFIATGVTTDFIDLVFTLTTPVVEGAKFRKLMNGKWQDFDVTSGDQIGSANADASGNCQGPKGKFNVGLRAGTQCIFMRIYDGGPNDADGEKNGTIVDPSGVLVAGTPNRPAGSTDSSIGGIGWASVVFALSLLSLIRIKRS